jgi:hypothetical protein
MGELMADGDLESRVRDLERLVQNLGRKVLDQGQEITRLRQELDDELTSRAIESLTPWPTTRVVILDALLNTSS